MQRNVRIDFATVCVVGIAIAPRRDTVRDSTRARVTNRNAIGDAARGGAVATGGDARVEVGLASIGIIVVTVRKACVTAGDFTLSACAGG